MCSCSNKPIIILLFSQSNIFKLKGGELIKHTGTCRELAIYIAKQNNFPYLRIIWQGLWCSFFHDFYFSSQPSLLVFQDGHHLPLLTHWGGRGANTRSSLLMALNFLQCLLHLRNIHVKKLLKLKGN